MVDEPVARPTRGLLDLDDSVIDRVSYAQLDQDRAFDLGPVRAVLPGGSLLMPWQQFALSMIGTAMGDRPVYFASSGNTATSLGLEEYLVRQGLAFKLNPGPLAEDTAPGGYAAMPQGSPLNPVTGDWVDIPRTRRLVEEVFVHRSEIPDWDHWPLGIPNYYAWAYYALAQGAIQSGDDEAVENYRREGEAWSLLGR